MKKIWIVALCLYALMFSAHTFADIYKCTGDGGAPTFVDSNTKANYKNCRLIMRENRTQSASSKQTTATPNNFPKVDKQTQSQRDDKRKEILLSELDTEQKALTSARSQRAMTDVDMHQKNIQLLQKEISALK
jgi:hypothetical protein